MRSFKITLPADTSEHNLFSLIVGTAYYGLVNGGTNETGITGAIPTNGILTDRVSSLQINNDTTVAGTLTVSDRNYSNSTGVNIATGLGYTIGPFSRNNICLKDYFIKGSEDSQVLEILVETY